jgi:quinoprotein glucose dehydrogenase
MLNLDFLGEYASMAQATQRAAPATLAVAALVGLGIALFHYLAPMTGVTGTIGALLVVGTSVLLSLFGLVLLWKQSGGIARLVRILAVLAALGTLVAAWLLHEFWLLAVTGVALLAVAIDAATTHGGAR